MTTPVRQRVLTQVFSKLPKTYRVSVPNDMSVLDHLLVGILQEGTTFCTAYDAYRQLLKSFYDLNELRVSHREELVDHLNGIPGKEEKAKRILDILRFVFETTYTYDLESMRKKPLKQAHKQLSKIIGVTDYAVSAAVQRALDGHALPIDEPMRKVLLKLQLIDAADDPEKIRTGLEHLIPKAKGMQFCLVLSELTYDQSAREATIRELLNKPKRKAATAAKTKAAPKTARSKK